jgi:hypothetical protein
MLPYERAGTRFDICLEAIEELLGKLSLEVARTSLAITVEGSLSVSST